MEKLTKIQNELKAPKGKRNTFGKFNYRSVEDIFEPLKPLLIKYNCTIFIADEILLIGERFYLKSIATIIDNETKEVIQASGFAKEPESQAGMGAGQLSGATASYARKYALGALLLIDNNDDLDDEEPQKKALTEASNAVNTAITIKELSDIWANNPSLQATKEFKELVSATKIKLSKNEPAK